jgi:hypothetical protein
MMPLKLDMIDVLGGVVAGNAPVASPDSPDFAKLVAKAGQGVEGLVQSSPNLELATPAPNATQLQPSFAEGPIPPRSSRAQSKDIVGEGGSALQVRAREPLLEIDGLQVSHKMQAGLPTAETPLNPSTVEPPPPILKKSQALWTKLSVAESAEAQLVGPKELFAEITAPSPANAEVEGGKATQLPLIMAEALVLAQSIENLAVAPAVPMTTLTTVQADAKAPLSKAEPITAAPNRVRVPKASAVQDRQAPVEIEQTAKAAKPIAAPPVPDLLRPQPLPTEPVAIPASENRTLSTISASPIDRALPTLVERMVAFTPTIIDAARDVAQIGDARDMKFNVRPETLGPVAVTIERTDAGQSLRLGVETPAAVQAVRQAEPTLNDPRNGSPFVNVTVDMTASDQRGRAPRAAPPSRQGHSAFPDEDRTAPALAGRYA